MRVCVPARAPGCVFVCARAWVRVYVPARARARAWVRVYVRVCVSVFAFVFAFVFPCATGCVFPCATGCVFPCATGCVFPCATGCVFACARVPGCVFACARLGAYARGVTMKGDPLIYLFRLSTKCFEFIEEFGEDEIYQRFRTKRNLKDYLCRQMTSDCLKVKSKKEL